MRHAGAVGYLTKGGPAAELVKTIRATQALESSPEKM